MPQHHSRETAKWRVRRTIVRLAGGIDALNETVRHIIHEGGGNGNLFRRYENPSTTGKTTWNNSRKRLLDEKERHAAALQDKTLPPKTVGPPAGHPGHRHALGGPVTYHRTLPCPVCGMACSTTLLSKTMLDFDGGLCHIASM